MAERKCLFVNMSLAFKSDSDVLIDGMKTAGVGDYFITSPEKDCDRTRLCVSEKVLAKCQLAGIERSGEDWLADEKLRAFGG